MSTTATYSPKTFSDGSVLTAEQVNIIDAGVYDTHYSNLGAHNSFYRGKSLGTSVTTAQYTEMGDGTFDDLFVGDYWTISSKVYRNAGADYYYNTGSTACTTHHLVIVPDAIMYSAPMNSTATTEGAYIGSAMYTGEEITVSSTTYTGLTNAKSTIESAFGSDHIVSHYIYCQNAVTSGYPSGGAWVTSTVDLMCEEMLYGSGIQRVHTAYNGTSVTIPTNYRVEKSQLPLFALNPRMVNIRSSYWLRDVVGASCFASCTTGGYASYSSASLVLGVRPAFLISAA